MSRSPVREALRLLASHGVARLEPNRGDVVRWSGSAPERAVRALEDGAEGTSYMQIAADWLAGRLPEAFTETELRRRGERDAQPLDAELAHS